MSYDKTKQEHLTDNPVRVLDLTEVLNRRGIDPEEIVDQSETDEDGKLAVELTKIGARRSAEVECSQE